jgi:nucleoside-diphosphate-sugar epimerase
MTRVLVTGATGFLGRHVVAALHARGCAVTTLGLDRTAGAAQVPAAERPDLQADLSDADDAERALAPWRWDACVHLAAPVTGGTEDLATGMRAAAVHSRIALQLRRCARGRVVHVSSMTVYGLPRALPVTEDHPRDPMHLYGLGKLLSEEVLLADPALAVTVVRFGGLFSEQRRGGALFHFCRAAREGSPLRVTATTPTPWELLHVDDAAEGVARAATLRDVPRGAINLGYGEPVELVAMAHRIAALGGRGSVVEAAPGVNHPPFQLDVTRARRYLAWDPPALEARLASLYEAFAS